MSSSDATGAGEEYFSSSPSPPPIAKVDHVCFVVHGMGTQHRYVQNLESLRRACKEVTQEEFPQKKVNIAWIPIEWHHELHQMDTADRRMKTITLPTCSVLRTINNDILADVLYYFAPFHGQTILDIIVRRLNEAYADFCREHPDFTGKINLIGHSLGGIICFDLLSNMEGDRPRDGKESVITYPKLSFQPSALFALGSPIGAVLVMRGQSLLTYRPPSHIIFHNLFHLYDPLAYRIEPLIEPHYAEIPPIFLQRPSAQNSNFNYYRSLLSSYLPDLSSMVPAVPARIPSMPSMSIPSMPSMPSMPQFPSLPSLQLPPLEALKGHMAGVVESMYSSMWAGGFDEDHAADNDSRAADDGVNGWIPNKRIRLDAPFTFNADETPDGDQRSEHAEQKGQSVNGNVQRTGHKRKRNALMDAAQSQSPDPPETLRRSPRRIKEPTLRHGNQQHSSYMNERVEKHTTIAISSVPRNRPMTETVVSTSASMNFSSSHTSPTRPTSYVAALTSVTDSMNSMAEMFKKSLFEPVMKTLEKVAGGAEAEADSDEEDMDECPSPLSVVSSTDEIVDNVQEPPQTSLSNADMALDVTESIVDEVLGKDEAKRLVHEDAGSRASARAAADIDKEGTDGLPVPQHGQAQGGIRPPPPAERLDFYVQDNIIDNVVQQYLIGLKAHFSYWSNKNIMYHIMKHTLGEEEKDGLSSSLDGINE